MSKDSVLIFCERNLFDGTPEILLILKNRPENQAGYYNLPGGKLEINECPISAVTRELKEETGYELSQEPVHVGTIKDVSNHMGIHVFKGDIRFPFVESSPRQVETEKPEWMSFDKLWHCPSLIPNLRIIIPLIRGGACDWVIESKLMLEYGPNHDLHIWFPTYKKLID